MTDQPPLVPSSMPRHIGPPPVPSRRRVTTGRAPHPRPSPVRS